MAIIQQRNLFDYMEIEELGDLERLNLCIDGIDDRELVNHLKKERKYGRNDYPVEVMLNLIYAMKIFSHKSVESFRRELSRNSQLRRICGLGYRLNRKHLVPPARVFTLFIKKLIKHQELLDKIFNDLVGEMYRSIGDFGKIVAGDGKIIQSYAKRKSRTGYMDGRCENDGEWISKTYYINGKDGKEYKKIKKKYGFCAHILCDVKTELPIRIQVTPANASEKTLC